jgi:hypothetical protein
MNASSRRTRTWRASKSSAQRPMLRPRRDAAARHAVRPELWLAAMACVGMLLVEVWQSSRLAQLCLSLERSRTALVHARARMEFVRARLERQTTRAEVAPLADELGLAPTDVQQVVQLPSAYLAEAADGPTEGRGPTALALVERAARVLVPDATARVRDKN